MEKNMKKNMYIHTFVFIYMYIKTDLFCYIAQIKHNGVNQ